MSSAPPRQGCLLRRIGGGPTVGGRELWRWVWANVAASQIADDSAERSTTNCRAVNTESGIHVVERAFDNEVNAWHGWPLVSSLSESFFTLSPVVADKSEVRPQFLLSESSHDASN